MTSVREEIQKKKSYVSFAHKDTYETRIRHYFKDMNIYYNTKNDLLELESNIFIYYFIISVESCDKKVDVVLSDPNFYFYKKDEQKPQKYQSIETIRDQIKTEFGKTSEHPHFSAVDYIVIEKYTEATHEPKRYFLMKTRDFENTFCYVEKIKTTLRTSDVIDIMSILIMPKNNSKSGKSKKGGGKLYTDVSVKYSDDDPVYYIQYQLLQRLGLDTYNTIAAMITDNKTPFNIKYESTKKDGINTELFNNDTITTRFTKICHSDTDQYVAYLHKKLKKHIITEERMTEIYDKIANSTQIKNLVFDSDNEKALITTYIQLLIEKWIDLYITIELNKELYVSNKLNNTASNNPKIDEVNNYMITQSSCKIDIIKYQLSLLDSLISLQKSLKPTDNNKIPKIPQLPEIENPLGFVDFIDKQIKTEYKDESYFHKLKTQFESVLKPVNNNPDLTAMNNTLMDWLKTMNVQDDVIENTNKVVNEYISTDADKRDFDTFRNNIQNIGFGNPASDDNANTASSTTTGVSANTSELNQFIPKMLVGLVASTSNPIKGTPTVTNVITPQLNQLESNNKNLRTRIDAINDSETKRNKKPTNNDVKFKTTLGKPSGDKYNNGIKTVNVDNNNKELQVSAETNPNSEGYAETKATTEEEKIERAINGMKNTINESIKNDKKEKITIIKNTLSDTLELIKTADTKPNLVKSKKPVLQSDDYLIEDDNPIDVEVDDDEDEQPTEIDTKPDYNKIKKDAQKIFNDNKEINTKEINKQITDTNQTLGKTYNTTLINEVFNPAKTSIIANIKNANNEITEAIKVAINQINTAIQTANPKHNPEKGTETNNQSKSIIRKNPLGNKVKYNTLV